MGVEEKPIGLPLAFGDPSVNHSGQFEVGDQTVAMWQFDMSAWPFIGKSITVEDFRKLRAEAQAAATARPGSTDAVVSVFERSRIIRKYALVRAGGSCERCGAEAPFQTAAGMPFLEVHHIRRLTDGGPDAPSGVAAVCPNCHREAHYGAQASSLNDTLLELIRDIETMRWADFSPKG